MAKQGMHIGVNGPITDIAPIGTPGVMPINNGTSTMVARADHVHADKVNDCNCYVTVSQNGYGDYETIEDAIADATTIMCGDSGQNKLVVISICPGEYETHEKTITIPDGVILYSLANTPSIGITSGYNGIFSFDDVLNNTVTWKLFDCTLLIQGRTTFINMSIEFARENPTNPYGFPKIGNIYNGCLVTFDGDNDNYFNLTFQNCRLFMTGQGQIRHGTITELEQARFMWNINDSNHMNAHIIFDNSRITFLRESYGYSMDSLFSMNSYVDLLLYGFGTKPTRVPSLTLKNCTVEQCGQIKSALRLGLYTVFCKNLHGSLDTQYLPIGNIFYQNTIFRGFGQDVARSVDIYNCCNVIPVYHNAHPFYPFTSGPTSFAKGALTHYLYDNVIFRLGELEDQSDLNSTAAPSLLGIPGADPANNYKEYRIDPTQYSIW